MSRTGLHRPRLTRAVSHRPASGTRLLTGSSTLTILHQHPQQALPKGPTPTSSQRSITAPPPCKEGPRTNHGTPSRRAARCAPHS